MMALSRLRKPVQAAVFIQSEPLRVVKIADTLKARGIEADVVDAPSLCIIAHMSAKNLETLRAAVKKDIETIDGVTKAEINLTFHVPPGLSTAWRVSFVICGLTGILFLASLIHVLPVEPLVAGIALALGVVVLLGAHIESAYWRKIDGRRVNL